MGVIAKNRKYAKIAGFWVITQKPLIISEILELLPFFRQFIQILIFFILYFKNDKR
jgi:hypothetical protein